jgi:hypothetical protein
MPNWCYNNIQITGEPKGIKKISLIIDTLRNEKDDVRLFQSLIGLPKGTDMDKYETGDWYNTNVEWFGTKWDVGLDFVQEVTNDYIYLSGETAWSPPIRFCVELAKLYNLEIEMYYEEPGSDFCGKCWIDSEGNYSEEDYDYQEGLYRFDGYNEWYDREWTNQIEWLVEQCQDEINPNLTDIIKEHFHFLTDEEVEECAEDLRKEMDLAKSE